MAKRLTKKTVAHSLLLSPGLPMYKVKVRGSNAS
jgi:hypothetical protein